MGFRGDDQELSAQFALLAEEVRGLQQRFVATGTLPDLSRFVTEDAIDALRTLVDALAAHGGSGSATPDFVWELGVDMIGQDDPQPTTGTTITGATLTPSATTMRVRVEMAAAVVGPAADAGAYFAWSQTVAPPLFNMDAAAFSKSGVNYEMIGKVPSTGFGGIAVREFTLTGLTIGQPLHWQLIPSIPGAASPRLALPNPIFDLAFSSEGTTAYYVDSGAHLGKINPATAPTDLHSTLGYAVNCCANPFALFVVFSTGTVWVLSSVVNGYVEIRDQESLKLLSIIRPSGMQPWAIDANLAGNLIYVSDIQSNVIRLFRALQGDVFPTTPTFSLPAGLQPRGLKLNPAKTRLAVTCLDGSNNNHLVVLDAVTGALIFNTVTGAVGSFTAPAWESPRDVDPSNGHQRLGGFGTPLYIDKAIWVTTPNLNKARRIDSSSGALDTARDITFYQATSILVSETGWTLYLTGPGNGNGHPPPDGVEVLGTTWAYYNLSTMLAGTPPDRFDKTVSNSGFGGYSFMRLGPQPGQHIFLITPISGVTYLSHILGVVLYCRPLSTFTKMEYMTVSAWGVRP